MTILFKSFCARLRVPMVARLRFTLANVFFFCSVSPRKGGVCFLSKEKKLRQHLHEAGFFVNAHFLPVYAYRLHEKGT